MAVTVRPLCDDDYSRWRPLWDGYTHFYDCYLEESVTASTWERALSAHSPMFCRVVEKDQKVIGFAMCILHEGTWSTAPICYLEDLFVDADERGAGAGKALIDALIEEGKREGWSKLYWVTRENNPARKLYDKLLDNALKFGEHAAIAIDDSSDSEVVIHIVDDGPGIPEAELDAVLQPFYRVETSRNRDTGGTGLGLAIAAQLTAQLEGKLNLTNRTEGGLDVSITLPRR